MQLFKLLKRLFTSEKSDEYQPKEYRVLYNKMTDLWHVYDGEEGIGYIAEQAFVDQAEYRWKYINKDYIESSTGTARSRIEAADKIIEAHKKDQPFKETSHA